MRQDTQQVRSQSDTPTVDYIPSLPLTDDFEGAVHFIVPPVESPPTQFEQGLTRLTGSERSVLPAVDGTDSGWQIGFSSEAGQYQVFKVSSEASALIHESEYRRGVELQDGSLVPQNSRIWLNSKPVLTYYSIPTNNHTLLSDPFLALAAPVVRLNTSITSLHRGEPQPFGTRISSGAVEGRSLFGHWAAATDRGSGARKNNQDAFIKMDVSRITLPDGTAQSGSVFICLDGMGGYEGGLYFIDQAERVIAQQLPQGRSISQITSSLLQHLENEIEESCSSIHRESLPREMGACILGVTALRYCARIEYQGDVRALIIRDGQFLPPTPTKDHSIPGYLERHGQIDEIESFQHSKRATVLDVPKIQDGVPEQTVNLDGHLRHMQTILGLDPVAGHEQQLLALQTFRHWIVKNSIAGRIHFHRVFGLAEQWQSLEFQIRGVLEGQLPLQHALYPCAQFVMRANACLNQGIELDGCLETIEWLHLDRGDMVVLFSDGVADVLFNSEVLHEIKAMTEPATVVAHLREVVHTALETKQYASHNPAFTPIERRKDDNVVILAYRHDLPYG